MTDAAMTNEPVQYDPEVAERALAFAVQVDVMALTLACEPEEKVVAVLDAVRDGLGDELSEEVKDLFIEAILKRCAQIERNTMMPKRAQ
jgi:hypothetical protein